MVTDLKSLTETLRRNTPENYLPEMIRARKTEIEAALKAGRTYSFRVPDGRQIHIRRRSGGTDLTSQAIEVAS